MEIEEKEEKETRLFKALYCFFKDTFYNYSLALIVVSGILGSFIESIDNDATINMFIFWLGKYVLFVTVLKGIVAFISYISRGDFLDLSGFVKFLVLTAILAIFCVLGRKGILVFINTKTINVASCTLIPTLYLCCKRISTGALLKYQSIAVKAYVIPMIILFILKRLTLSNVFDRYAIMLSALLSLPSIFLLLYNKEEDNIKTKNRKIDKVETIFICLALIIGCTFCLNESLYRVNNFKSFKLLNCEFTPLDNDNKLVSIVLNQRPDELQNVKLSFGIQNLHAREAFSIELYE